MQAIRTVAIGAALAGLAACASGQNAQYKVVTVSYESPGDEEAVRS
jgi:ABC-type glycerol-3-phosphate transport system substrate-binding protein